MSNWVQDLFHVEKPIITMCRLQSLPGDPYYDADGGMERVTVAAKAGLLAPQEGGVDDIMLSSELNLPYPTKVEPVTIAAMARVVGELKPLITVPYDVNCLWDPIISIDLAVAIDGKSIRKIVSGARASDFRLWNTSAGKTVRRKMAVSAKDLELLFNIMSEAARYLADRDMKDTARSMELDNRPDALYVSGLITGSEVDTWILGRVEASVKRTPTLCSTECNVNNITRQLSVVDGVVCATIFKYDGVSENAVDVKRVEEFMDKAKKYQATL